MRIEEYDKSADKKHWLEQIGVSDWKAGQFLYQLLSGEKLKSLCGEKTRVILLTEGKALMAFCTLAEQDDIRDTLLGPWIGFVYTFPKYRGRRCMGLLLDYAYAAAREDGAAHLYISTNEIGLYEKFGYSFYQIMKDRDGKDSRVYKIDIK